MPGCFFTIISSKLSRIASRVHLLLFTRLGWQLVHEKCQFRVYYGGRFSLGCGIGDNDMMPVSVQDRHRTLGALFPIIHN